MIASIPMNEQNLQTEVCVSFGRAPYFLLFDTQGTARWLTNTAAENTGGAGVAAAGTDFVLLVAEPSVSGISDLQRVAKVVQNFGIPIAVCVNKSDTCPHKTQEIRDFCQKNQFAFVGEIPYDNAAVRAVNAGIRLASLDSPTAKALRTVYKNTLRHLCGDDCP